MFIFEFIHVFLLITFVGSGYYLYFEASSGSTGYKADLVSKLLSPKHVLCMELWYNMYGLNMGSIDVYIKVNFTHNKTPIDCDYRYFRF